ncbi:MAG: hypothetical protein ACXVB1_04655, partial [Pseudobdellovibrionaceae bacterium]
NIKCRISVCGESITLPIDSTMKTVILSNESFSVLILVKDGAYRNNSFFNYNQNGSRIKKDYLL